MLRCMLSCVTGALLNTLEGHNAWVWSAVLSANGNTVVSGGSDKTVRIWNAAAGAVYTSVEGGT